MHEYSLAMDMMEIILKTAQQNNAKKINSITISIGLLAHANPVQLEFCLRSIGEGTLAENSEYIFREKKSNAVCSCGFSKTVSSLSDFSGDDKLSNSYDALIRLATLSCPDCGARLMLEDADTLFVESIDIN